jgi:hypothetical protein
MVLLFATAPTATRIGFASDEQVDGHAAQVATVTSAQHGTMLTQHSIFLDNDTPTEAVTSSDFDGALGTGTSALSAPVVILEGAVADIFNGATITPCSDDALLVLVAAGVGQNDALT